MSPTGRLRFAHRNGVPNVAHSLAFPETSEPGQGNAWPPVERCYRTRWYQSLMHLRSIYPLMTMAYSDDQWQTHPSNKSSPITPRYLTPRPGAFFMDNHRSDIVWCRGRPLETSVHIPGFIVGTIRRINQCSDNPAVQNG